MFTESNIQTLIDRLGWSENESDNYMTRISSDNLVKDSGLTLNSFHKLVTVENIYHCHPQVDMSISKLNAYLKELLDNVVREILNDVFVMDYRADVTEDYSSTIANCASAGVFDNAIGYCHAVKVLELISSNVRSNRVERLNVDSFQMLKSELEGYRNPEGRLISRGVVFKCKDARENVKAKFYGTDESRILDATYQW